MKIFSTLFLALIFLVAGLPTNSPAFDVRVPLAARQISLDPTKLYDQSSLWISRHLHCQLVRKIQGKIILEAAASLEYLTPKKVKIVLKADYRFQTGESIQADDLVATFEFLKDKRESYRAQYSMVDRVSVVDSRTIVFDFKKPTAKLFIDFFSTSQNPILAKAFIERAKTNRALLEAPIGCGNYRISEYIPSDHITLVPLKKDLPRLLFSFVEKNQVTVAEVSKYDLVNLAIEDLGSNGKKTVSGFTENRLFDPYHLVLGLNATKFPWNSEANRCSLFGLVDTSVPIQSYGATAIPAKDLFPSGVVGFNSTSDFPTYYKGRAAKVPNLGQRPFCLSFVAPSVPVSRRSGFLKMIETIYPGVQVKLIVDPKNFGEAFLDQKCDGIIIGFKSNNLDGADFLNVFTEKSVNYTGFWSNGLKDKVVQSFDLDDSAHRADIFKSLAREIRNRCLILPIMTVPYKTFYTSNKLEFPGIGKSILNEYYLGSVLEKKQRISI